MEFDSIIPYLIPAAVVLFFVFRFLRFKKIRTSLAPLMEAGAVVVDVRNPGEFASGARPGSLNIPLSEIAARSSALDKTRTIIVCCASGTRSGMAAGILKSQGFQNVINAGPWTNTLA